VGNLQKYPPKKRDGPFFKGYIFGRLTPILNERGRDQKKTEAREEWRRERLLHFRDLTYA